MGFSEKQVSALRRKLDGGYVRTRRIEGRELSYIEGWHAISEANRIFGFDGWDRETVETKCILARETRGTLHAVYIAKVRVTVRAQEIAIVREGYGTGEGHGTSLGEVHERALKMAETDATKRALATFGRPFGLALYVSAPRPRDHQIPGAAQPPIADNDRRRTQQQLGSNGRYYVPPRRAPVLDPDLKRALQRQVAYRQSASQAHGTGDPADRGATSAVSHQTTAPPDRSSGSASASDQSDAKSKTDDATKPASLPTGVVENTPGPAQVESPAVAPSHAAEAPGELLIERPRRQREPAHLKYVMGQPCLLCGRTPSDAHHLRFAQPRALGRKVSDEFVVPLCRTHHRLLHQAGGEVSWWMDMNIDPLPIAQQLWDEFRAKPGQP